LNVTHRAGDCGSANAPSQKRRSKTALDSRGYHAANFAWTRNLGEKLDWKRGTVQLGHPESCGKRASTRHLQRITWESAMSDNRYYV